MVSISCVWLWTIDGAAALARDTPGLAALSPLMAGMNAALVEEAVGIVLRQSESPVQDELLTVLGVFAEDLVSAADLNRLISRERVMSSTFIRNIFQEEFDTAEADWREDLQQMVGETVLTRFPETPAHLYVKVRQIADRAALKELHRAILHAADQAEAERILARIGERAAE